MRRRALAILVLALLGTALVSAAGQQEAGRKPITLNFYHYASQTHILYIKPLKEAFEKAYPNISLQSVEVAKGGYEALSQKVLLGLAAGDPPDVAQVGYTLLRTMVESGSAVPLDQFMASDPKFRKDNLFPAMMRLGQAQGKQYLVPIGTSTPTMFNNVDLFASVGVDTKNMPASWEETRKAAAALKSAGKLGVLWGWSITGNWIFQAMIENAGGRLADPEGTRAEFDSPAGLKVMRYLADLAANGLMPVTDQTVATFVAGNLGMLVDSSFQRVNTPKQANFTVRMSPMPTPDGSPPEVPAGGNGAMIFAKGKDRQEASWKFIRFITEAEASRIVAENSGYTPANQEVIRELKAKYGNDVNYKVVLDQAARVTPWYSWPGKNSNKISKVLRDMQEAVLLGKATPEQGLKDAAAEVNALLKE